MFDGLGFLLLQEIFFCRVLDIRVAEVVRRHIREVVEFHEPFDSSSNGVWVTGKGGVTFLGKQKVLLAPFRAVSKFQKQRRYGGH